MGRHRAGYYARNREKFAAYHRKHYHSKRRVVESFKSEPCADCGVRYPPYVMDFDHRPGTEKKFDVSKGVPSNGVQRLLDEIAKCDVVCANCHRIRTHFTRKQVI